MVRTAERSLPHNVFCFIEAGNAINLRHLQRFFSGHRRQDGGDAASQHGFPGAGRAGHEHIMRSGSRDFHGLLRQDLPLHFRIVHLADHLRRRLMAHCRRHGLPARQKFHQLPQISGTIDCDIFTEKGFAGHLRRHDKFRNPCLATCQHHGQNPRHRTDFPFQRQLADENRVRQHFLRHIAAGRQESKRNGKIETGAIFLEIRRRQIHRHLIDRKMIAGISNGRVHTLLRLLHRRSGEPHDIKRRKCLADIYLYSDDMTVQAKSRGALYFCIHSISSLSKSVLHVMKFPAAIRKFHHFHHIETHGPLHLVLAV